MMFTIYYVLPVLILIRLIAHYRRRNLALVTLHKLEWKRGWLEKMVASGEVDDTSESYDLVYRAVNIDEAELRRMNIWVFIYLSIKWRKRKKETILVHFENELKDNEKLNQVYQETWLTIYYYLVKSSLSFHVVQCILYFVKKVQDTIRHNKNNNLLGRIKTALRITITRREFAGQY